jgi:hypothetical protein
MFCLCHLPAASARVWVWVWARMRGLPNLNLRHPDAHQPALYDELAAARLASPACPFACCCDWLLTPLVHVHVLVPVLVV